MKKILAILMVMSALSLAQAETLGPVQYIHTPTSNVVFVACYWWTQFPNRDDAEGRHLMLVCLRSTWQGLTAQQRTKTKQWIRKLLSGETRATCAKLREWSDAGEAAGVPFKLILPGQALSGAGKILMVVVPHGVSPSELLAANDIVIPEDD